MATKVVVLGLIIFTIVTITTYLLLVNVLYFSETTAAIIALGCGLAIEVMYRKKKK
ncbi:hypothetical protein ACJ2A9_16400 [Anaerobacillus sp. MEB173]|uniref:hypothetical protein n=1 Tax=Anaerobacillus sp. MEB173 TaxID=3383345 RepID=UPI003F93B9CD